jgi:hypothetical protein
MTRPRPPRWSRGIRLSSLARALGCWIRILLKAWMSVCVPLFCVCVVLYVGRGLATGWSPSMDTYRLCVGSRNRNSSQGPAKGCGAIIVVVVIIMMQTTARPHKRILSSFQEGRHVCRNFCVLIALFSPPCVLNEENFCVLFALFSPPCVW